MGNQIKRTEGAVSMWRQLAGALLVVAGLLVCAMVAAADRGQVAADAAVLTSMYGSVQTRHGTGGYTAAHLNEVLKPGDAIKTGADARAELSLSNGGWVRMNQNSQLLITYIREGACSFQALVGGVWVTLERALRGGTSFEVRMPSAVASVRGTVFRCEVSEGGESATYVYEGEVEITAGEENLKVRPNEFVRVPPGLKAALQRMNLAFDDEEPWVTYNRHRDIARHLGNPTVMVALNEQGLPATGNPYPTSNALAAELQRNGILGAAVTPAHEANFTFAPDGMVRWRQQPEEDYCIVGVVRVEEVRELRANLFAARAAGRTSLVEDGDNNPIVTVEATAHGVDDSNEGAVAQALNSLGTRLAQEMAPRLLRELMAQRPGVLRVDITNASREQIAQLRDLIHELDGVINITPLRLPGGRFSLAVAGGLDAATLAAALRNRAADTLEMVQAGNNILYVRFKGGAQADVYRPDPGAGRSRGNSQLGPGPH